MKQLTYLLGKKLVALGLIALMAILSLSKGGYAMLVPAEMVNSGSSAAPTTRTEDLAKVQKILENKMLRQRLSDVGLNETEINQRLAKLSDQDVHQLASQMDSLLPAGDAGGLIVGVLVITLLVLLVIYLAKRI